MGEFGLFDSKKAEIIERNLRIAFSKIREEFDDQREAINENTNEIQSNFELSCELDKKIEKLSERLDNIQIYLTEISRILNIEPIEKDQNDYLNINVKLTRHEKEVFGLVYCLCEQNIKPTLKRISTRLGYTNDMAKGYLLSLMEKGIPLTLAKTKDDILIDVEPGFRKLQAKKNILDIDNSVFSKV